MNHRDHRDHRGGYSKFNGYGNDPSSPGFFSVVSVVSVVQRLFLPLVRLRVSGSRHSSRVVREVVGDERGNEVIPVVVAGVAS